MPRFRVALMASAIFVSATGAASAADLPAAPLVPVTPVFSWTGFYVGANVGYGWGNSSGNMITTGLPDTFSTSGNAFVGGGQMGFNYQFGGGFVLGAEADFQGSFGSGTLTDSDGLINATVKDPWFGTIRGRIGYAMDRVLL
ncbi:MAG: autotransporter domain-containing protein, partial [Hyphomicrobiales bacterium]|nr:autotransporter domain-containing protein [Hyphomicrobiales bacterium]